MPELVASGFSSFVYRTADGACLRVARTADAAERMRYGLTVGPALATAIGGVEAPELLAWLAPSSEGPFGAARSTWLSGQVLDQRTDPQLVGRFLKKLHSLAPAQRPAELEPYQRWQQRQCDEAREGLSAVSSLIPANLIARISVLTEDLASELATLENPTVIHGDFWHENALHVSGLLTGVLDWEASAVGDPAADLAGLWYLGDTWARAVVEAAGASAGERRRCASWRILRELEGARWAAGHDDSAELTESAAKLAAVASAVLAR